MATHSSVLAWRIPGTGAWWAAVYGVAQSRTQLKPLAAAAAKSYIFKYLMILLFFIHSFCDFILLIIFYFVY